MSTSEFMADPGAQLWFLENRTYRVRVVDQYTCRDWYKYPRLKYRRIRQFGDNLPNFEMSIHRQYPR